MRTLHIGLGTVQFGLDYGISNTSGRVSTDEVSCILSLASAKGISVLDTAAAYGNAEACLGEQLPAGHGFRIVTKLLPRPLGLAPTAIVAHVEDSFRASLDKLRCQQVAGLLVHRAEDLLSPGGEQTWSAMCALRDAGAVQKIGASVYSGAEINALLARYPLELVQLPINVLDQRLIAGGQLARLKQAGVEIHARSLLLQGVLAMPPESLPTHLRALGSSLRAYRRACAVEGLTPVQAALLFAAAVPEIDHAIMGVTSAAELAQLLIPHPDKRMLPLSWFSDYAQTDAKLINPALWSPSRV
jgi:aryl-alcohol dehydrogenase-like predicted oxidoreductase